jgi:hypothetical protein
LFARTPGFSLWYLKENAFIARTDNGRFSATAQGADWAETEEATERMCADHLLPVASVTRPSNILGEARTLLAASTSVSTPRPDARKRADAANTSVRHFAGRDPCRISTTRDQLANQHPTKAARYNSYDACRAGGAVQTQ